MEKNTWVLVTNSNLCHIYKYNKTNHNLIAIKEFFHLVNKLKNSELAPDKPGQFQFSFTGHGHSAHVFHSTPKETEVNKFIIEIATFLDKERALNSFENLILILPDHILGLMNKHLSSLTKNKITKIFHKNVYSLNEDELVSYLKENLNKQNLEK